MTHTAEKQHGANCRAYSGLHLKWDMNMAGSQSLKVGVLND